MEFLCMYRFFQVFFRLDILLSLRTCIFVMFFSDFEITAIYDVVTIRFPNPFLVVPPALPHSMICSLNF